MLSQTLLIGAYFIVIAVLAVYGFHRSQLLYILWRTRKNAPVPKELFQEKPLVTIQLPMFNELYVAERLLDAVALIEYPRDRLEIQVLDDSIDETRELMKKKCEALRAKGLDVIYLHRTDRSGFKAGALEAGLAVAKGEFVAIFDADFIPPPTLLLEMIDHFTDERVGMVQARWEHINRDFSTLTKVQAILLDGHFLVEHAARNRSGRFFNFNGTAGIWRKSTIQDAGGWQHDTLTEDLDLSYRAQLKGWRFVYLPQIVAPAELPVEMNSFKTQQFRWAKGSIQTMRKLLPMIWRAKLPWKVKSEALFHLTNNFAYGFLVLLAMLSLPTLVLRSDQDLNDVLMSTCRSFWALPSQWGPFISPHSSCRTAHGGR
jgi:cellulose synthase/poly-beta-1,6-N-acetylglucosamine synthase-like glycosyltransferase